MTKNGDRETNQGVTLVEKKVAVLNVLMVRFYIVKVKLKRLAIGLDMRY